MSALPAQMSPDELTLRLQQQELVARFGLFALEAGPEHDLLTEACRVAAEGLLTRFAKVLRFRPVVNDLLVVAGVGWHAGVVGHSTLGSGLDSPAGFALHTGQATLANDLAQEQRFRMPALLAEHGVQSALNVVVGKPNEKPFGVLEVDSTRRHEFMVPDVSFLQALSNVLAAAMARSEAQAAQTALLQEKDLLMREVHHRVTNSLQLVRTILALQSRGASDDVRAQLENASGRIMSIAAVHRRLFEGGSVTEGDAVAYLKALVDDMGDMIKDAGEGRRMSLDVESMVLPADNLTPLGLIVSELITNALKHASGPIDVTVRKVPEGVSIRVEDGGKGFGAEMEKARKGLGMRLVASLAKGDPARAVVIDREAPRGRITVTMKI